MIPSQMVSLGRVTFGPKVSYLFKRDGKVIEPHIALKGIWDFDKAGIVDLGTGLAVGSTVDLRARIEGGISLRNAKGFSITGEGFYDGIGVDGFQALAAA